MTTLNARANQAWAESAWDPTEVNYAFEHQRAAFEEGWETGYKTARTEVAKDIAQALLQRQGMHWTDREKAAQIAREIGEAVVTRSVEIPDEAVAKGAERLWLFRTPIAKTRESCTEQAREVITAALPYLAPAGDGGLRFKLGQLVAKWRYDDSDLKPWQEGGGPGPDDAAYDDAANQIAMLLDELPPAVPQPAGRYRLAWLSARRRAAYASKAFFAEARAARELEAAVPQPVDREALGGQIADAVQIAVFGTIDHAMYGEREHCNKITDAVLAVLAGEQEQVEQ